MYRTRFEMPLRDFIAAHEIPDGDNIHVVRPANDDDGEMLGASTVYEGKAGDVGAEIGATTIDALKSDFWRNQGGYWHIETPPVKASEAA